MTDTERVHIWSNGTEFMIWEANNCDRCVKAGQCEIEVAISVAYCDDGLFDPAMAQRMGHNGTPEFWCRERQTEGPVLPPPAAYEMAKAGAAMLPGLDEPRASAVGGGGEGAT